MSNQTGLQYMRAIKFVFDNPNWLKNLALLAVCQFLVPIVGPLVAMGYLSELIESFHRSGEDSYADFDFNRFSEYLSRGLPLFLVQLAMGMVIGVIGGGLWFVGGIAGSILVRLTETPALMVPIMLLMAVVVSAVILVAWLAGAPLALRAIFLRDISGAFDLAFIKDFVRKVWVESLLKNLFLGFAGMVLVMIGMLLFCVGMYPAAALAMLAQYHMLWQLYELYLARGGIRIPLHEESAGE